MNHIVLIFDCDGVLIDSPALGTQAEADCYSDVGISMTREFAMERFAGMSDADAIRILETETGLKLPTDMQDKIDARKRELFATQLTAVEGVQVALESLNHVPSCVASSSSVAMLEYTLRLTGLYTYFNPRIYSAQMVRCGKPQPDLFLYAAKQMNAKPDHCVIIEDSVAGVQAGKAAGSYVIGFTGGSHCDHSHGSRLLDAGADLILRSMSKLPAILPDLGRRSN